MEQGPSHLSSRLACRIRANSVLGQIVYMKLPKMSPVAKLNSRPLNCEGSQRHEAYVICTVARGHGLRICRAGREGRASENSFSPEFLECQRLSHLAGRAEREEHLDLA